MVLAIITINGFMGRTMVERLKWPLLLFPGLSHSAILQSRQRGAIDQRRYRKRNIGEATLNGFDLLFGRADLFAYSTSVRTWIFRCGRGLAPQPDSTIDAI